MYNPFIWLIVALPIIPLVILMFWNPVLRLKTAGTEHVRTEDPAAIFTLPYILLVASGFLIYGVSSGASRSVGSGDLGFMASTLPGSGRRR